MDDHRALELVQATYGAFGRGDVESLLANLDPRVRWISGYPATVPIGGTFEGHAGVLEFLGRIGAHVEVQAFEPQQMFVRDATVVVLGRETARVKSTGTVYTNAWVHVFRCGQGRIEAIETHNDTFTVARAFEA